MPKLASKYACTKSHPLLFPLAIIKTGIQHSGRHSDVWCPHPTLGKASGRAAFLCFGGNEAAEQTGFRHQPCSRADYCSVISAPRAERDGWTRLCGNKILSLIGVPHERPRTPLTPALDCKQGNFFLEWKQDPAGRRSIRNSRSCVSIPSVPRIQLYCCQPRRILNPGDTIPCD